VLPVILWTRNRFPPEIAPAACPLRACLPCCACGRRGCRACGRERRPAFPADRLPVQSSQGLPGKLFPLAPSVHLWGRSVFAASWGAFSTPRLERHRRRRGRAAPSRLPKIRHPLLPPCSRRHSLRRAALGGRMRFLREARGTGTHAHQTCRR